MPGRSVAVGVEGWGSGAGVSEGRKAEEGMGGDLLEWERSLSRKLTGTTDMKCSGNSEPVATLILSTAI